MKRHHLLIGLLVGFFVGAATFPFVAYCWIAWEIHRGPFSAAPVEVSDTAKKLASKVSPRLQKLASERLEPAMVGEAKNAIERFIAHRAAPRIVARVPEGTEYAVDGFLTHFHSLSIGDIAGMLAKQAEEKGESVHPSIRAAIPVSSYNPKSELKAVRDRLRADRIPFTEGYSGPHVGPMNGGWTIGFSDGHYRMIGYGKIKELDTLDEVWSLLRATGDIVKSPKRVPCICGGADRCLGDVGVCVADCGCLNRPDNENFDDKEMMKN